MRCEHVNESSSFAHKLLRLFIISFLFVYEEPREKGEKEEEEERNSKTAGEDVHVMLLQLIKIVFE